MASPYTPPGIAGRNTQQFAEAVDRNVARAFESIYGRTAAEIAAGVTPSNYAVPQGNILRYGAAGDGVTDCAPAIQAAINVARKAGGGEVLIPEGRFRFEATLEITDLDGAITIRGVGRGASVLLKAFDGDGIEVTNFAAPCLHNFTLDRDTNVSDTGVGIKLTLAANGTRVSNVLVQNQGSHGIEILNGNLGHYDNVITLSNGGDGIKFNGNSSAPDANACVLMNIDTRGNAGWGLNIEAGWSNFGLGITAQHNTTGGVRMHNARANILQVYEESNGAGVVFKDHANCAGNIVFINEGGATFEGTTATSNMIIHVQRHSVRDPNFSKLTADKFILPNVPQAGLSAAGILTIDHPSDGQYNVTASDFDTVQTVNFKHANAAMYVDVTTDGYLVGGRGLAIGTLSRYLAGAGSPEGSIDAPIGSLYSDTTGGKLYFKRTGGAGSTGWVEVMLA